MKLTTFCGHLVPMLNTPMSEFTELMRALKEQSSHFDPDADLDEESRRHAEGSGFGFEPDFLRGRAGPGGGVEADPFRAAFFLLAVAISGPRKDCARSAWKTWHLVQAGTVRSGFGDDWEQITKLCALTDALLFGEALQRIVADPNLAARVDQVRISSELTGEIWFDGGKISKFQRHSSKNSSRIYRIAVVDGSVWRMTSQIVQMER